MAAEPQRKRRGLRTGFTTGACAAAAARAAAEALVSGRVPEGVDCLLPNGQTVPFAVASGRLTGEGADRLAEAVVIKDAGDDPDCTHGAHLTAAVRLLPQTPGEVRLRGGPGIGTVTQPGLGLEVGGPAINPVPRRNITANVRAVAGALLMDQGLEVTLSVPGGEAMARKTLNPRLGILGGLSILGTTGIVRPFSCSAYVASIQQAIDVARANGLTHVVACTGAATEHVMRTHYPLPDMALIEMGDFVGAVLKHLRRAPIPRLTLAGGFGKISKLAAGHLDLHSRSSSVDLALLAVEAATLGADGALQEAMRAANTSQQALALAQAAGLPLGDRICALARAQARAILPPEVAVEVWATDREGRSVGHAGFA